MLIEENKSLKEKLELLEGKYRDLEARFKLLSGHQDIAKKQNFLMNQSQQLLTINSSTMYEDESLASTKQHTKQIKVFPPLRVRLQKLNEKRVALKWAHNPKNYLNEINGYNIYINNKLCGKMSPNDMIASINGNTI